MSSFSARFLVVVVLGVVSILLGCAPAREPPIQAGPAVQREPQYGGIVRVASPWTPEHLDSMGRTSNGNFSRYVWEGLIQFAAKSPSIPWVRSYVATLESPVDPGLIPRRATAR
jgi:hypothetical protein